MAQSLAELLQAFKNMQGGGENLKPETAWQTPQAPVAPMAPEVPSVSPMDSAPTETDPVPPTPTPETGVQPNDPSLFKRISDKLNAKQKSGDVEATAESKEARTPAAEKPAPKPGPTSEITNKDAVPSMETGYQLGTLEQLKAAQDKASGYNRVADLFDAGTNFLNNTKSIGDIFLTKPSGTNFVGPGDKLRAEGAKGEKDYAAQVENQKNDPKSQTSVEMRNLIRQMGFPVSDNVSAQDLDKKFPGLSNIYSAREAAKGRAEVAKENRLSREAVAKEGALNRKSLADSKHDEKLDQLEDKFGQNLLKQENAGSRSALGKNVLIRDSADRISQLVKQVGGDTNKLTNQQAFEISRALDNMLSQGQATVSATDHLNAQTMKSKLAGLQQFASGEPVGAELGAMINNQMETVKRERELADKKVVQYRNKVLAVAHPELISKRKAELEAKVDALAKAEVESQQVDSSLQSPATSQPVKMIGPDGKTRLIPAEQVDAALKAGGKLVQ